MLPWQAKIGLGNLVIVQLTESARREFGLVMAVQVEDITKLRAGSSAVSLQLGQPNSPNPKP